MGAATRAEGIILVAAASGALVTAARAPTAIAASAVRLSKEGTK
jgi:hypothetical protein